MDGGPRALAGGVDVPGGAVRAQIHRARPPQRRRRDLADRAAAVTARGRRRRRPGRRPGRRPKRRPKRRRRRRLLRRLLPKRRLLLLLLLLLRVSSSPPPEGCVVARLRWRRPVRAADSRAGDERASGAVVDSWDKLRVSAFTLLARHPAPLAGVETREAWERRANQALAPLRSPRVRESDAAALSLRLLFRKYARDGGGPSRTSAAGRGVGEEGTGGSSRRRRRRAAGGSEPRTKSPRTRWVRQSAAREARREASSETRLLLSSPSGSVSSFFFGRDAIRFGFLFLSGAGGRSPETPGGSATLPGVR